MRNLTKVFVLLCLICIHHKMNAQNYYEQQWKKISASAEKGQYQSNLPLVLEIQNRALRESNAVQLIKSLKAEFSIVNLTQEDAKNDAASRFFKKLQQVGQKFKGEENLILRVLAIDFFKDFYLSHAWEINPRTNISSKDVSQMETWSKLDFKNYLGEQFAELSSQQSALQRLKMAKYAEIFRDAQNISYFPTFFDYHALQFIDYLNNESFFTRNERSDHQTKVSETFAALIRNNTGNARLYFEHRQISQRCDFMQCNDRLKQLTDLYHSPSEGEYKVLVVEEIVELLKTQQKFKEALVWIEKVKKAYPKSAFLNNIKNQENQIIQPVVNIKFESAVPAQQPIHLVAEYKNAHQFGLNLYEVKEDYKGFLKYLFNSYDSANYNGLGKMLLRKEVYDLPKTSDYQLHKTALEIKPLPTGIYVGEVVVDGALQEKFFFLVSNSRIIHKSKNERNELDNELMLVNRNNGKTLPKENLEFYEFVQQKNLAKSSGTTDDKAGFKLPASQNQEYYRLVLLRQPKTNDFNLLSVYGNNYSEEISKTDVKEQAQIFLDREIYRPGQTVYFKVIVTAFNGATKKETVAQNVKLNVILNDVHGEELSKQILTTNNFGSVNGNFVLPQGKLNGQFSIQVDREESVKNDFSGQKYFRVEEYKRPKFEVSFEPVKDEYQYGKTMELKGRAMMFSGVPLGNAAVHYEIKKRNIRWRYFWWYPRGNDNENSILGTAQTNEKGEFTIKLDLKKDETLEGIQIDNYEINASVTDINGETQSANTNIRVASVSHYIALSEAKDSYFTDETVKVKGEPKNYNDQPLKKSYTAKLSKLEEPQRVFRNNFENEVQNLPVFSKEVFAQKFPHDYFDKSEKNPKVSSVILNGEQRSEESLDLGQLSPGKYRLELYNIEGKDTIRTEKVFEVFDKTRLAGQKPFLKVIPLQQEYRRSEKARFYVYSAVADALVNVFVQNGDGKTQFEQKALNNGVLVYELPLPQDEGIDRLNVQFQLVAFNDVQTVSQDVKITSDKKPLRIETVVFRDKLQPNSKEKWTVRILGDDREKIAAEVLANMYDQSLDQFAANTYFWQPLYHRPYWITPYAINEGLQQKYYSKRLKFFNVVEVEVPDFNWFDEEITYGSGQKRSKIYLDSVALPAPSPMAERVAADSVKSLSIEQAVITGYAKKKDKDVAKIPVRQNLNETAFFYPHLMTDKDGNVSFEFTAPEALTQWKLTFLAHTRDARAATLEKTVVTQKDFSVTPNYPRFLREGDEMVFKSKLSNLNASQLSGLASLQILDAYTNEDISSKFNLQEIQKSFTVNGGGSTTVQWYIQVPNGVSSIIVKNVAQAGSFSDGEQKAVAVLPNRMLVTDAVPVFVKEGQTKTFVLENLKNNASKTATNISNTLELTTNPIWEVLFALPSLKNDNNLSADVVFNKWFADVLAAEIFKAHPKMKTVFEEYQSKNLLQSNLDKNQELKQLLLEETPWLLNSKNEEEQMTKLARLFDANTMRNSLQNDWSELQKLQNPDGGFSWYAGYPSSYYSSLYILKNLGKINEWLKGNTADYQSSEQKEMVTQLIGFVDREINRHFDLKKENVWSNFALDYLDTRHYWEKQYPLKGNGKLLKELVIKKAKTARITDFTFFGLHRAALLLDAYDLKEGSRKLLTYLQETAVKSETQGVYWKQNLNDWGWYRSNIVNHAGALEAFNKLTREENFIEEMKIWLLTQKEVSSWDTSRSTAEVIFTVLNSGKLWTSEQSDKATVVWGGKEWSKADTQATGYIKSAVKTDSIDKNLATVTVSKPGPGIVQGGLFWQYYEDLDQVKSSETYLSITKELYRKLKTANGEELQKISENAPLKIGDKVTVRMILNTDRPMEFIHLKDMRAAGFEPVDVLSGYQWKNNLGYYQVTKDTSTHFYIEYMPKGKYVFEYDYLCNAAGRFSNGITTMQNYYAPQMNAHTSGARVRVME